MLIITTNKLFTPFCCQHILSILLKKLHETDLDEEDLDKAGLCLLTLHILLTLLIIYTRHSKKTRSFFITDTRLLQVQNALKEMKATRRNIQTEALV